MGYNWAPIADKMQVPKASSTPGMNITCRPAIMQRRHGGKWFRRICELTALWESRYNFTVLQRG
jgi:hypothetical protein